jgi:hypothetical protein
VVDHPVEQVEAAEPARIAPQVCRPQRATGPAVSTKATNPTINAMDRARSSNPSEVSPAAMVDRS